LVIIAFEMVVNIDLVSIGKTQADIIGTMSVGEMIRALRKERGWSQIELAEKVGLMPQNVSRYEKGHVQPRESTLANFAEAFGVPLSELTNTASAFEFPKLDPEIAEYVRAIPTLSQRDQDAVKAILKALVTAKKAQSLFS
jgi:transcriptional regulator with XRE-family HTH domain